MNGLGNLVPIMKGRSAIYSYFSMVLAGPPEKQFLGLSGQFMPAFGELGEKAAPGTDLLKHYVEKECGTDADTVLNTLATNYTTLFYIGTRCIPSSESVYLSSSRLVKQKPWEQVMAFYHIRKFKRPEHIREPEDHISIELSFMDFMCNLMLYMLDNSHGDKLPAAIEEQKRFLDEHLLKWADDFCSGIIHMNKYDEFGLYSAVAHLLPVFLESDRELLESIPES